MSNKVEDFFIAPLESHFESIPNGGPRDVLLTDMEEYDADVLNATVEWLKRNRQSQKTFPSPKECRTAVKAILADQHARNAAAKFTGDGKTYGEKLRQWVATVNRAVEIKKGTFEWSEWEIYFRATRNVVQWPEMERREAWTVPTRTPSEFDPNYNWQEGKRLYDESRRQPEFNTDRMAVVQKMLGQLKFNGKPPPKPEGPSAAEALQKRVDERFTPNMDDEETARRLGLW